MDMSSIIDSRRARLSSPRSRSCCLSTRRCAITGTVSDLMSSGRTNSRPLTRAWACPAFIRPRDPRGLAPNSTAAWLRVARTISAIYSFTGAETRREGKFVQADRGTLFLDEIGETSKAMQVKLLRVLQEHELQRVGGDETVKVDVRIIAATNKDLEKEVKNNNFREDLYYRLNVVMLEVPPLRQRGKDIRELVTYFAGKYAEKNRRDLEGITAECMNLLTCYPWPGNVRELENAIERGIILMRGTELTERSLPLPIQKQKEKLTMPAGNQSESLFEAEKQLILKTLAKTSGNKSEASRRLGITRKTLLNKLNKYDEM